MFPVQTNTTRKGCVADTVMDSIMPRPRVPARRPFLHRRMLPPAAHDGWVLLRDDVEACATLAG